MILICAVQSCARNFIIAAALEQLQIGAPEFAILRTIVMNLVKRACYRSIRQGLREMAYDIQEMLALGGVATRASSS